MAEQLGLPAEQLQAKPYKLLLYERGGHFQPHRDSEKIGRMVASLVIVLPTKFSGGELVVRHGSAKHDFDFSSAANERQASYVAFYADCEHEVRRVTRGRRLAMTYNLSLKKPRKKPATPSGAPDKSAVDELVKVLRTWYARRPGDPVIFALEHQYTQKGLKLDLLKGADRSLSKLISMASDETDSRIYLAQVERHLLQYADDGSYGRRSWGYRDVDSSDLDIGEAYEDELNATFWVDRQGKRHRFGDLPLDSNAIISAIPVEEWKPTSEEYEGYTGNAGNTLDRWYHRSAIVVWDDAQHFDVLSRAGTEASISLLHSMLKKLGKTPKKRLDAARDDCTRLMWAIVRKWPTRYADHYRGNEPWLREFVVELANTTDLELQKEFLSILAHRDKHTSIDKLVLAMCRDNGVAELFPELEMLLLVESNQYRPTIALRDFQWLSRICCDTKLAEESKHLKKLCAIAVGRFCESFVQEDTIGRYHCVNTEVPSKALPHLVKSHIAVDARTSLKKLVSMVRSSSVSFPLASVQVPCITTAVSWAAKKKIELPPVIVEWLEAVRAELKSLTASEPEPPKDWSRPANVQCTCRYCQELNAFLTDANTESTRIAASQHHRDHIESQISRFRCDASHKLEKTGRPYALRLKKNTVSHKFALERYKANVQLLKSLPESVQ